MEWVWLSMVLQVERKERAWCATVRVGETRQEGMTNSNIFFFLRVSNESLFGEQLRDSSVWEINRTCSKGPFVKGMPKKFMVLSQAMQVLNEECQYMVFCLQLQRKRLFRQSMICTNSYPQLISKGPI